MSLSIQRDDLLPARHCIGRWCEAAEGRRFDVSDPATDSVPDSGAADASAALEAARAAFGDVKAAGDGREGSVHGLDDDLSLKYAFQGNLR